MEFLLIGSWLLTTAGFLTVLVRLLDRQAEERRKLYDRIQAPEVAAAMAPDIEPASVSYVDERREVQLQEEGRPDGEYAPT